MHRRPHLLRWKTDPTNASKSTHMRSHFHDCKTFGPAFSRQLWKPAVDGGGIYVAPAIAPTGVASTMLATAQPRPVILTWHVWLTKQGHPPLSITTSRNTPPVGVGGQSAENRKIFCVTMKLHQMKVYATFRLKKRISPALSIYAAFYSCVYTV